MRKTFISPLILTIALSVFASPATAERFRLEDRADDLQQPLVRLRVDPTGSVIRVAPNFSRYVINSSFNFVSANCVDCAHVCPPFARTVEVVLQANTAVAAGYGVSNLTSLNYAITDVAYSTQAALTAGQSITVTITGDVLDCANWFNVFFSVCDSPQADPRAACLDQPREVTVLHDFIGGANDGELPNSQRLTLIGSTFFGMASYGGDNNGGVIYSIDQDGTGYALLHEFAGGTDDGERPNGYLLPVGSTFYGLASAGGDSDGGVLFSINTDGSAHTLLHEFAGGVDDGRAPYGSLTLVGSTLFGMTRFGGDFDRGVIFSIDTDGTGYTLLHEFTGGPSDGSLPYGSLTFDGSILYGMTYNGGDSSRGVIFSIGTDGTGYSLLHEFLGGPDDGAYPYGSLTLSGSALYGLTYNGGDSDAGVIFSINGSGTGFTLLHEFVGGVDDGSHPFGSLTIDGTTVYGMTNNGGDADSGVIFSINRDGSWYDILHEFAGSPSDGANPPYDGPVIVGSAIYGATRRGGTGNVGQIVKLE